MTHGGGQRQRRSPALVAISTLAVLLSGSILLVAILAMRDTRIAMDGLIDDYARTLIRAHELNWLAQARVSSVRAYLLTRNDAYLEELAEDRRRFDETLKWLAAGHGVKGSDVLGRIQRSERSYREAIERVIALAKRGDNGTRELIAYFETNVQPRYEIFRASMLALAQHQEERLQAAAAHTRSGAIRATSRVVSIGVVALVLILLLAILAARAIGSVLGRAREQAQESTAEIRRRDDLISIASHDLRNPLNAAMMQLQMLDRSVLRSGDAGIPAGALRPQLARLQKQVSRELELLEALLDLSRLRAGGVILHREPVQLHELVQQVADEFRVSCAEKGCELLLDVEPVSGYWDRSRLEQLIGNLLSNALKFGAERPVEIRVHRAGDYAVLSVRDHGRGVAPEERERIFGQFEQGMARSGGAGLGLWIAREIVRAHGGEIHVEDAAGGGARFMVALPSEGAPEHPGATSTH